MNKKEPMSLSEHYNLRYTLNGVVWLIYAVINLLPNNIVTKVLCIVALIMAIITSSIVFVYWCRVCIYLKYGSKYSQVISVRYRSGSTSYWHFILAGRKDE